MKTTTVKATTSSAWGKDIPEIKFSYDFEELQKGDEIPAKEVPTAADILDKLVNPARKAKARQAELTKVLKNAGYEQPKVGTGDLRYDFDQLVAMLQKMGKSDEQAVATANRELGTDFSM